MQNCIPYFKKVIGNLAYNRSVGIIKFAAKDVVNTMFQKCFLNKEAFFLSDLRRENMRAKALYDDQNFKGPANPLMAEGVVDNNRFLITLGF